MDFMFFLRGTANMHYLRSLLLSMLICSSTAGQQGKLGTCVQTYTHGMWVSITSADLRKHWAITGAGILGALCVDRRMKQLAIERGFMSESLARFGYEWGGKWAAIGILPGIFLTETLKGSTSETKLQRLGFAFTSLAMVGVTTEFMKYTLRRSRPNKEVLPFPYGYAFPSGHASAAFGVAEVVRILYGNHCGGLLYGFAIITGLSRIHDNRHWLSDIIGGAGLGIGLVRGFHLAQKPRNEKSSVSLRIGPGVIQLRFIPGRKT